MNSSEQYATPWLRIVLLIAGTISLILGIVALILPIIPTTPFLLIAAACYFRSSQRFYDWLLSRPYFGKLIRDYREGQGIPFRVKILTIVIFCIALGTSTILFISSLWIRLVMLAIAVGVSIHILKIKTLQEDKNQD